MKAVLVHGYNVRDKGKRSVDTLAPYLDELGYDVDTDSADYGWWGLMMIYLQNKKKVERRLAKAFKDADLIVTHSNGANFATRALNRMSRDTRPRVMIHFSPALDRDTPTPYNVLQEYVFFSRKDWIVRVSAWLPFLPWGKAGSHGKLGPGRYTNLDWSSLIDSHSGWFEHPKLFAKQAYLYHQKALDYGKDEEDSVSRDPHDYNRYDWLRDDV